MIGRTIFRIGDDRNSATGERLNTGDGFAFDIGGMYVQIRIVNDSLQFSLCAEFKDRLIL